MRPSVLLDQLVPVGVVSVLNLMVFKWRPFFNLVFDVVDPRAIGFSLGLELNASGDASFLLFKMICLLNHFYLRILF
jgi:hypothetical protein